MQYLSIRLRLAAQHIILWGTDDMKDKIKECFDRLQTLDIVPTISNMEKLLQTLYDLRDIYQSMKEGDHVAPGSE